MHSTSQTLSLSYGRCIAEFLNEGSLVRLWSTRPEHLCWFTVRTAISITFKSFSCQLGSPKFRARTRSFIHASRASQERGAALSIWHFAYGFKAIYNLLPAICHILTLVRRTKHLNGHSHETAWTTMPRTLNNNITGTGILTRWPSPTLNRLGLGPTNPGLINIAQETLLFRW